VASAPAYRAREYHLAAAGLLRGVTPTTLALLFLLGLGLSAAPGALNVETVRRGLRHGFSSALTLQLGALLGDAVWVGATTAAHALGLRIPLAGPGILVLGGAAMLWTAWRVARPGAPGAPEAEQVVGRRGLALGAALALSSPVTVVFWAAVQAMVHQTLGRAATATDLAMVAAAYGLSVLLWALGLSGVAAWGRHLVRPRATRLLNVGCAVLLAAWGIQLIGRAAVVLG
jgi:chemosensory pili system protein ChpE